MEEEAAARLVRVGGKAHAKYARSVFNTLELVLAGLDPDEYEEPRESIEQFIIESGHHIPAPGVKTTAAGDIALYVQHSNRHLGMIEALRGAQGLQGTATN